MIQRAITAIIGIVIGLFATFAVFSAILGGLDSFYLLTQDACNYGSDNSPKRVLRVAPENPEHPGDADEIDWSRDGLDVVQAGDGCQVEGVTEGGTHLTPTGDEFVVSAAYANLGGSVTTTHFATLSQGFTAFWTDGEDVWYKHSLTQDIHVHDRSAGSLDPTRTIDIPWDSSDYTATGIYGTDSHIYVTGFSLAGTENSRVHVHDRSTGAYSSATDIVLDPNLTKPRDLFIVDGFVYVMQYGGRMVYAHAISTGAVDSSRNLLGDPAPSGLNGVAHDGRNTYYLTLDDKFHIVPGLTSVGDARDAGTLVTYDLQGLSAATRLHVHGNTAYTNDYQVAVGEIRSINVDLSRFAGGGVVADYNWVEAENVFTAQERLVTLLAVIAAIGMPIGAMTAIVFFGQAVISSGISGSGASQVMVAIAAVVVILVSIQMFQQFAGFLGNAFDAVNGDRFVVFDETLGSLAETIAEFWGVLAFAGFINIASIVWRNYSGNFSIGGTQGGL